MHILFVYPMGKQKTKAWGPLWAQSLREQARNAKKRPGEKSRAFSISKKRQKPLFRVFARACVHAFGAHLSLERGKKPRTGRGFLQIG